MRHTPLLQGLAEEDLERLHAMSHTTTIPAGTFLMREGEPGDTLYIIIDGELEILKSQGGTERVIATRGPGEVIGEMAVLQRAPRFASVRTLRDSRLFMIDHDTLATLLSQSPSATQAILDTVVTRLRESEAIVMQREKLAALGTIAAGLAHELNNPAAAIVRSASQLRDTIATWERVTTELANTVVAGPESSVLADLRAELLKRVAQPLQLDPLTRGEQEDSLQDWLEDLGVEPAWEVAPVLVAAGWNHATLEPLMARFPSEHIPAVVHWLSTSAGLSALLEETRTSAEAISQLVTSVKGYAYLDQAPEQEVDVHEGLEDTLIILKHKLGTGITLRREYARGLPRIEVFGSELNRYGPTSSTMPRRHAGARRARSANLRESRPDRG